MAVTEAFMMGLPVLATEYTSAREQIRDGVDGMIVENSTDGIWKGLQFVLRHLDILTKWKEEVINTDYSNTQEMKKVIEMIR